MKLTRVNAARRNRQSESFNTPPCTEVHLAEKPKGVFYKFVKVVASGIRHASS